MTLNLSFYRKIMAKDRVLDMLPKIVSCIHYQNIYHNKKMTLKSWLKVTGNSATFQGTNGYVKQ